MIPIPPFVQILYFDDQTDSSIPQVTIQSMETFVFFSEKYDTSWNIRVKNYYLWTF